MYSLSQVLRRAAAINRQGIASRYSGRHRTWDATARSVRRTAGALRQLGIANGERVGLLAANSDDYFQWLFAVPWAGGVVVPVNTRFRGEEIVQCLNDAGCQVLLVDDLFVAEACRIRHQLTSVKHVVHAGQRECPPGCLPLDQLVEASGEIDDAGRGGQDIAALYYTGGTTGRSKGVMLTHEGMVINTLQWAQEIGVGRADVLLIVAPMFHLVGGLNSVAAGVLAAGVCIMPKFDVKALLETIAVEQVSKAAVVPTMLNAMVSHPEIAGFDLSSLKRISYGGSPISPALLRKVLRAMPHVQLFQVYGQTEGGPNICILKPGDHRADGNGAGRLASAGQPIVGTEVAIMDDDDAIVGSGTVGEICVRGLTVAPGYWGLPEETARTNRGGWLHTGDAGYLDEDGFLYIVDRVKDMIITGGENVYSQEVESILYEHPAVQECVVFGIPDERWGERVHAVVRLKDGTTADGEELIAHCRTHLAGYKCIRSVDFRTEPFPLSGANKILKRELRAAYWLGTVRPI